MNERIDHTPYAWRTKGDKVVLLRAFSLKPIWMIGLYVTVPLVFMPMVFLIGFGQQSDWNALYPEIIFVLVFSAFCAVLAYCFFKGLQSDQSFWLSTRRLAVGEGIRFSCESFGEVVPTGVGGTLKGVNKRWLVLSISKSKRIKMVQVYEEPDLTAINHSLACLAPEMT